MNYNVEFVSVDKLVFFPNHPYKVDINEDLRNLQHSIEERGIDEPLIVRRSNDKLQIISGHRRYLASKLANLQIIPVRIVDLDDDQAAIMLVDSNLHRRNLLHSELAFAYKMKYEALKHQGKVKDDLTSCQIGTKYKTDTAAHIAKQEGTSRRQIYRYIHLTNLNKELLDYLDQGRISFNPAVELSYLDSKQQNILLDAINDLDATPSFSQAQYLRKLAKEEKYTEDAVYDVLGELKPNQKEKLKIDMEELSDYFSRGTTPNEMKKIIFELLNKYYLEQDFKKDDIDLKI